MLFDKQGRADHLGVYSMRHKPTFLIASILGAALTASTGGCGAFVATTFPNQLISADGEALSVEELEQIAQRLNVSDDEKRDLFRSLGIEDEKLIDALLGL